MKAKNIEDGLALVGAIVVLIGVSLAADDALAEERAELTNTTVASYDASDSTRNDAERANAESAAQAVARLAFENEIELDIRLKDHTSTLEARGS